MASNTLYTSYSQHDNSVITVSSTSELKAAMAQLDNGGGGTILLDGNGGPYKIAGSNLGDANNPILIKGADPNNPPTVEAINLQNCSHVAMTELYVDSSGGGSGQSHDILLTGSDNIEIVGNTMDSTADGYLSQTGTATKGADLAFIRNSQDITFSNNMISDYAKGATFRDVDTFDFSNNEMTGIQFDGLHGAGWVDATITNNYMHDFYGSTQTLNHSDFIQIYSTNATLVTSNVNISGNILDTGDGAAYQGIFITSQNFGSSGASGQYYQDIKIYDNLVHTGKWNGIVLGATQNAQVYDNSVLFNFSSYAQKGATDPWTQGEPWIKLSNTPNAQVFDNVASKITVGGTSAASQNYLMSFTDPNSSAYYGNHIQNLDGWSNEPSLNDLSFKSSSPLYGSYGSYWNTVGGTWDSGSGANLPAPPPTNTTPPPPAPTPTTPIPTQADDDDTTVNNPPPSSDTGGQNPPPPPSGDGSGTSTGDGSGTSGGDATSPPPAPAPTNPVPAPTNTAPTNDDDDPVNDLQKVIGKLKDKPNNGKKPVHENGPQKNLELKDLIKSMQITDAQALPPVAGDADDEDEELDLLVF